MALSANDYTVVLNSPAPLPTEALRRRKDTPPNQNGPLGRLLGGEFGRLAGFGMARLAMHMKKFFDVHVKGFDISSSIPGKKSQSPGQLLRELPFECLYKMLAEEERIDAIKPRQIQGEFSDVTHTKEGDMVITNERYKTRVRASNTTRIIMHDEHDNEFVGRANGTSGKRTSVKPFGSYGGGKITKIKVIGKEERTLSERARDSYFLMILQGLRDLNDPNFPLIKHLWFPDHSTQALVQKETFSRRGASTNERLNDSQAAVVDAMVNSESPFIVVHGPPGTGKTSTISAAVKRWFQTSDTAWLVAQSNVGVKNIAERLCKDDIPFRLIVSKDFYFEWHEHIYEERIKEQMLRTDEFPPNALEVMRLFQGVRVVLCTLSTLSNPILTERKVFYHVPLSNLVVDEASQIGIFNYLRPSYSRCGLLQHLFGQFKTLTKVCFFGDPKQRTFEAFLRIVTDFISTLVPPHGQEAAVTMESIFDVQHLKPHAYFLNTQYRMPEPLGNFISNAVYNSKLKSSHVVKNPSCVAFVDANLGEEERKGMSFKVSARVRRSTLQ
ncbi:hypothetical protein SCHPADRAFT_830720 [Schizopora paradoxa]|uniref:DNA2/NAM7 helicase helicase domain-containing protein n=1 Tax=Schizopora paradoxa TaxID=27342 RepID=A0A0H2S3Y4_9AGAM|nr:hypothetical protein SCHPADRAFT_830720 [Schizopora paradoxa]